MSPRKSNPGRRLLKISEVQDYLRHNPHIWTGYRANLDLANCFRSVFSLHNESVNIWTHLAGFFVFAALLTRDYFLLPSEILLNSATAGDLAVLVFMTASSMACMAFSSVYHTLMCHSKAVNDRFLALDLMGIKLAFLGIYVAAIYFGFWCHPFWQAFYNAVVFAIFCVIVASTLHPKYPMDEFCALRTATFVGWAMFGIVPAVHGLYLQWDVPGIASLASAFLPNLAFIYVVSAMATLVYATRFPECCFPGRVDILGHSHQWWYLLILVVLVFTHKCGLTGLVYVYSVECGTMPGKEVLELVALF